MSAEEGRRGRVRRFQDAPRSRDVKRRHWAIALGSAGESAAALDLVNVEQAASPQHLAVARERLRLATLRTLGLMR